jgi:hypothetical protein
MPGYTSKKSREHQMIMVGKNWKLYTAVVEANEKLREKVPGHGKVELHPSRPP